MEKWVPNSDLLLLTIAMANGGRKWLTKIFILLLRSVTVDRNVFHKPPLAMPMVVGNATGPNNYLIKD
jgi:hypothetical protein